MLLKDLSDLETAYEKKFRKSKEMFAKACRSAAFGIHSDIRALLPFPVFMERSSGCHKWSVEQEQLIDFWMGHGALILGHGDERILKAVERQLRAGTHFSAPIEGEQELCGLIQSMVPSAEKVRFVGTGTESASLALRLARSYTGKNGFIRFAGHYHGWLDEVIAGAYYPYGRARSGGVIRNKHQVMVTPNSISEVLKQFDMNDDIGAVILEPSGGWSGAMPIDSNFVAQLRELCTHRGAVLIFDEMVTGFRLSPGGYQAKENIVPDLTLLGKALFAGFPGAAVVGKQAIMDLMLPSNPGKVSSQGTWNAFPLSIAAGIECLRAIKPGQIHKDLESKAKRLKDGLNAAFKRNRIGGKAYGQASLVHIILNANDPAPAYDSELSAIAAVHQAKSDMRINTALRIALLLENIDFFTMHINSVSAAHTDDAIDRTVKGMDSALSSLTKAGFFDSTKIAAKKTA